MPDPFEIQQVGNPRTAFALHHITWQQCGMVWLVSLHLFWHILVYAVERMELQILGCIYRSNKTILGRTNLPTFHT
jgi:hypothetical protein